MYTTRCDIKIPGTMRQQHSTVSGPQFVAIVGITAVLFFVSLVPLEVVPNLGRYRSESLFHSFPLLPVVRATLVSGLGIAIGEGIRDPMEGYGLDPADRYDMVEPVAIVETLEQE
jgi:hypothetical protein